MRGKIYTLTGPEALSFNDAARILSEETVRLIRHVEVPADALRTALEARGVESWFGEDMAKLHRMFAGRYEDVVTEDVRTVTDTPPRSFAPFARDYFGAFAA